MVGGFEEIRADLTDAARFSLSLYSYTSVPWGDRIAVDDTSDMAV